MFTFSSSIFLLLGLAIVDAQVSTEFTCQQCVSLPPASNLTSFVMTGKRPEAPALRTLSCSSASPLVLYTQVARVTTVGLALNFTTRLYCLELDHSECFYPGPHIHVYPGDTCRITIVNAMDSEADRDSSERLNSMHYPNHVNLHTHGLHVSPAEDNVIEYILPRRSRTYTYKIPDKHMPGLNWYHAHYHGASALHVMGGAVGPLTVVPPNTYKLPESYRMMANHTLVFTHVALCDGRRPPSEMPFNMKGFCTFMKWTKDPNIDQTMEVLSLPSGPSGHQALTDFYFTNGAYQPAMALNPGVFTRFDLVNAVADRFIHLNLRYVSLGMDACGAHAKTHNQANNVCDMILMALDGVFLTDGPRNISEYGVILHPGARASIAIRCPKALLSTSSDVNGGTVHLSSCGTNTSSISGDLIFNTSLISFFQDDSHEQNIVGPEDVRWDSADIEKRPFHLQDLRQALPASNWDISVGLPETNSVREKNGFPSEDWLGVGSNCSGRYKYANATAETCSYLAFGCPGNITGSGAAVDQAKCPKLAELTPGKSLEQFPYRHVAQNCDIEQLSILHGDTRPHPLHFHTFHLQVQGVFNERNESVTDFKEWGQVGDFRDTIPTFQHRIVAKYQLARWSSLYMYHCHFLMHEDFGMMDRFWVNPRGQGSRCSGPNCNWAVSFPDGIAPFMNNYTALEEVCPHQDESTNRNTADDKLSPGAIAGIVIATGTVVVALVVCICCWCRRSGVDYDKF